MRFNYSNSSAHFIHVRCVVSSLMYVYRMTQGKVMQGWFRLCTLQWYTQGAGVRTCCAHLCRVPSFWSVCSALSLHQDKATVRSWSRLQLIFMNPCSVWQTGALFDSPYLGVFWSQFQLEEFITRIIHEMQPIPLWWSQVKTVSKREQKSGGTCINLGVDR